LNQAKIALLFISFAYLFVGNFYGKSEITLSDKKLIEILSTQEKFFSESQDRLNIDIRELGRKAQEIVSAYESYLSENSSDTDALILFGKFLKKVGQEEYAIDYFVKADEINPKLAVVKQQLANYLVENGKPVDAFPYLILTVELAPFTAAYHFNLGNFIYLFEDDLINDGILSRKSAQSFMHRSFQKACEIDTKNFEYSLRFAQSFFDYPESNKVEALSTWGKIEKNFPERSDLENEYFRLCKARILLELGRKKEAHVLLNTVRSKSLEKVKKTLLNRTDKNQNSQNLKSDTKQSSFKTDQKIFLPSDPHLKRLQKMAADFLEEKMLSELKSDAIRAKYNNKGEIEIEFSKVP
jgi:tetratricopeptide (TPR) repeat protein